MYGEKLGRFFRKKVKTENFMLRSNLQDCISFRQSVTVFSGMSPIWAGWSNQTLLDSLDRGHITGLLWTWASWEVAKGNSRRAIRLEPLRSDGSHDCQAGRLSHVADGRKRSKENQNTTLGSQGTYLKQEEWKPKKESTYSFSGDVEAGRWSRLWSWWWSENHCAITEPCNSNLSNERNLSSGLRYL